MCVHKKRFVLDHESKDSRHMYWWRCPVGKCTSGAWYGRVTSAWRLRDHLKIPLPEAYHILNIVRST